MSVVKFAGRAVAVAAVAAAGFSLVGVSPASAAVASATVSVPGGLQVARAGADLSTLNISWRPAAGAARYTVTVFDGVNQNAFNVDAQTTSFVYTGAGECTRYRVVVTAWDAAGGSASTNAFLVAPLAPGGITNMTLNRSNDGATATIGWTAPAAGSSYAPVSNYKVLFRALADGSVLVERNSPDAGETVTGLEAARTYVAEIVPSNEFGSCAPSKVLVRGPQPSAPTKVSAVRDENDPQTVNVSWTRSAWTGYTPLTGQQIGVRNPGTSEVKWVDLPADATTAAVKLPNNSRWSVWIRGVNGGAVGEISKEFFLERPGAPGTPAIDPKVTINEADGKVAVTFNGPVGSSTAYPNMTVAIAGSVTDSGFKEAQTAFNRAQTFTFNTVPCGAYTIVVTGNGAAGSQEFGRKMINRCDTGLVKAENWKLVFGKATIAGNNVDMTAGNEARVISMLPRTATDMVYTTDATLLSGSGYGIWTRAKVLNGAAVSGYTFQYDPGYENVNPGFGKALLLRVWQDGKECGTPIARVKWPVGLEVNATHKVTVVTKGDSLYATIDGTKMFDVPSLKAALAASKCNMAEPTGSQVGFRTWSATGKATFRNTTIN